MECEEIRNQFTDYLRGELAESARAAFQHHLLECVSCRNEAESLERIWQKLGGITVEQPDSVAMRARLDMLLEAYHQGMERGSTSPWWQSINSWIGKWWPRQPAFQAAFGLMLLVIGAVAGSYLWSVEQVQNPELDQLRAELRQTRQMVALSLIRQSSASERLLGVSWSHQIEQPDNEILSALLDTLMHDSNVNVRLATVDSLRKFAERQIVRRGALEALERQESPLVQVALIDFMVEQQ
jgi:anti-sigma factor RsiW